jgi:hypothetical protein
VPCKSLEKRQQEQEKTTMTVKIDWHVGLDVHRSYCMVGAVDSAQQVVPTPRKVGMDALESFSREKVVLPAQDYRYTGTTNEANHLNHLPMLN